MKLTINWLLTACLLTGLAGARPSPLQEREYKEANLYRRLAVSDRTLQERRELALKLRMVDLLQAKRSAEEPDNQSDPTTAPEEPDNQSNPTTAPSTPASPAATPGPTSAVPVTVLTPTGSAVVIASQGTTQTFSLNATSSATATSTVVVVVTNTPGNNAAIGTGVSTAFTSLALVGALLGTYFS